MKSITATVLLLACLAASALAAPMAKRASATVVGFAQGNVTINNANSFAFRGVQFVEVNVLGLWAGFVSVAEQLNATATSAQADVVAGTLFGGLGFPVTGWLAYFDAMAKWSSTQNGNNNNLYQASLTASGAAAGIAFVQVDEVNANNVVVATQQFSGLTFTAGNVQQDATGNIKYGQITSTLGGNGATFTFTQATSSVYGKLTYGAVVTPKSTEIILEIANWPYQTTANHLNLTVYTAAAVANVQGQATVNGPRLSLGTGAAQAYLSAEQTAVVNGNTVSLTNQITVTGSVDPAQLQQAASQLHGSLSGVANANLQVAKMVIAFPAGASNIIWDPAVGFEQPQTNAGNSAYHVVPAFVIIAAAVAAVFAL